MPLIFVGNSNLLRKYIYGPRVDEPVCMLDVADNNAAYYHHFDGLGSVVALSNSNGDSCQSYEYSVYGQVAASDPNFLANPYMFTGRRFDIETGLYYYRARYYNPHIGRFMQTDPVGYADGINWYLYCKNNPLGLVDQFGSLALIHSPTETAIDMLITAYKTASKAFELLPEDWQEAATIFSMWVRGTGPDTLILGPGNALTELFKDETAVEVCRRKFQEKNAGLPPEEWQSVTVSSKIGLVENLTETTGLHFIGNYIVTITPGEGPSELATITVKNPTK